MRACVCTRLPVVVAVMLLWYMCAYGVGGSHLDADNDEHLQARNGGGPAHVAQAVEAHACT